ncbi:hypothetical protein CCP3SC1_260012 [Gammaproteobacteria bacterium]
MAPLLLPGDQVMLTPLSDTPIVGTLLVWRAGEGSVLHRLVAWWPKQDRCVETGDASLVFCERRVSEILGRVIAIALHGRGPWIPLRPPIGLYSWLIMVAYRHWLPKALVCRLLRIIARWQRRNWFNKTKRQAMQTKINNELQLQQIDDELMVYDPTQGQVHLFNSTARQVWEALEADRTPTALANDWVQEYGLAPEQALADVQEVVRQFIEVGLWKPA